MCFDSRKQADGAADSCCLIGKQVGVDVDGPRKDERRRINLNCHSGTWKSQYYSSNFVFTSDAGCSSPSRSLMPLSLSASVSSVLLSPVVCKCNSLVTVEMLL